MWSFMDLIRNFFTHKDYLPEADRLPGTLFTPLHFATSACWIGLIVLVCLWLRKKEVEKMSLSEEQLLKNVEKVIKRG